MKSGLNLKYILYKIILKRRVKKQMVLDEYRLYSTKYIKCLAEKMDYLAR